MALFQLDSNGYAERARSLGPSLDLDDGCTSGLHSVSVSSSVLPFPVPWALVITSSKAGLHQEQSPHRDNQNSAADLCQLTSVVLVCLGLTHKVRCHQSPFSVDERPEIVSHLSNLITV